MTQHATAGSCLAHDMTHGTILAVVLHMGRGVRSHAERPRESALQRWSRHACHTSIQNAEEHRPMHAVVQGVHPRT